MNTWNGSGVVSKVIGMSANKKSFMYQIACKDTKYLKSNSEFITCIAFGKCAAWCEKWVKKGIRLNVEGRLHNYSKKREDGTYDNYSCVISTSHELTGSKNNESFSNPSEKELPMPKEFTE